MRRSHHPGKARLDIPPPEKRVRRVDFDAGIVIRPCPADHPALKKSKNKYVTSISQHTVIDILLAPYRTFCLRVNMMNGNKYFHSMKLDTRLFQFRTWMKHNSNILMDLIIIGVALLVTLPFYFLSYLSWVHGIATTVFVVLTTTMYCKQRYGTTTASKASSRRMSSDSLSINSGTN